jgi:ParB family chromosome partitioning protein
MPLQLDDLAALDAPAPGAGAPLLLGIDTIDEDAQQPRREFDPDALDELAASIRERGVRQPVSVRPHPQHAGRWVLNFGARRLRASRLAGCMQIPAFVDTRADDYDQVIENEQRAGLRPLELALFVQKRLALGDSQAQIARTLGKSRPWVTYTTALIDPPDWLLELYRQGRCTGLKELYELRRLHETHPQRVETWVAQRDAIGRGAVASLRVELSGGGEAVAVPDASASMHTLDGSEVAVTSATHEPTPNERLATPILPPHQPTPRLHVEMHNQDFELVVSAMPAEVGYLYVRPLGGGPRQLVPAAALTLRGFVRR